MKLAFPWLEKLSKEEVAELLDEIEYAIKQSENGLPGYFVDLAHACRMEPARRSKNG
jgi:hypothetical protein